MAKLTESQAKQISEIEARWEIVRPSDNTMPNTYIPIAALPSVAARPIALAALDDIPVLISLLRVARREGEQ